MFASEADYIFYTLPVTQQLKQSSQINITLKKFCTGHVTAGMLSRNFTETVKSFKQKMMHTSSWVISKAQLLIGKKNLFEVLAMVKQVGLPTFFMNLICVDLRWDELISIIASLRGEKLQDEDI